MRMCVCVCANVCVRVCVSVLRISLTVRDECEKTGGGDVKAK